jgi:DtxR family Mn-dependent transcriptional regulator
MLTYTEENYLKSIYSLTKRGDKGASTNDIADKMQTKASSVTDMLKKLGRKGLINYTPYKPVYLSDKGRDWAIMTIRKHRLWEVFLVEKLNFKWDEVHEIAEELEHVNSTKLIDKLDDFLGNPSHDQHGDPIPDKSGNIALHKDFTIADLMENQYGMVIGLKDTSSEFLQFLESTELTLGKTVRVKEVVGYDQSMVVSVNMTREVTISHRVAKNLYIKKLSK